MQYRREIDGLRAVAVLPVILHHAAQGMLPGGFTGVDIFFVISGYLITAILAGDIASGHFSLATFYERRARRILPALFVVVLACLPVAWIILWPAQLREFGQSIVAVVFFVSNIFFWRKSGYFDDATQLKPLIHTWSLGVEEQFYLLFPLLLLGLWRLGPRRAMLAIAGLALVSLLAAEHFASRAPSANFYLAPTRAWELLAGALCALFLKDRQQPVSEALSLAGLAMLVAAFLWLDEHVRFPGFSALLPVVGTALIILFAAPGTLVGRLLSTRPFVGIGLISYSAYLWHQPLFAFARHWRDQEPPPPIMAGLALLTLLLAWASWAVVERPFRRAGQGLLPTRRRLFLGAGAACLAMLLIGGSAHLAQGFPGRYRPELQRIIAAQADRRPLTCFTSFDGDVPRPLQPACHHPGPDGRAHVLLMGDSHSQAVSGAVGALLKDAGIGHDEAWLSACLPLPGFVRVGLEPALECAAFVDAAIGHARAAGIDTLVITARWPRHVNGHPFDNGEGGKERDRPHHFDIKGQSGALDSPERQQRVLAAMRRELAALAGEFRLVLVMPVPEAGWRVPRQTFDTAVAAGHIVPVTTDYGRYRQRTQAIAALFRDLSASHPGVQVAHIEQALCAAASGRCLNADAEGIYYYDNDHLSTAGARRVAPIVMAAIAAARAAPIAAPIAVPGAQPGQRASTR